jgi:hypothetical protein
MEIDARHIGKRHVCRGFLADFLLATGSLLAKLCRMKRIRLILCLLIFIPGCSLLAGMNSVHIGSNLTIQMILGAIIGLFFGLVYGGAEGKWLDCIYPPAPDEEDDIPRVYNSRR